MTFEKAIEQVSEALKVSSSEPRQALNIFLNILRSNEAFLEEDFFFKIDGNDIIVTFDCALYYWIANSYDELNDFFNSLHYYNCAIEYCSDKNLMAYILNNRAIVLLDIDQIELAVCDILNARNLSLYINDINTTYSMNIERIGLHKDKNDGNIYYLLITAKTNIYKEYATSVDIFLQCAGRSIFDSPRAVYLEESNINELEDKFDVTIFPKNPI